MCQEPDRDTPETLAAEGKPESSASTGTPPEDRETYLQRRKRLGIGGRRFGRSKPCVDIPCPPVTEHAFGGASAPADTATALTDRLGGGPPTAGLDGHEDLDSGSPKPKRKRPAVYDGKIVRPDITGG